MATSFEFRVLTAEKSALEAEIVHLQAPGSEGFLGVLAHHAPLITALVPGPVTLEFPDGRGEVIAISGGFLEVGNNQAVVLADALERPDEIDLPRATSARDRARRRLAERPDGLDVARAKAALGRALNRIHLADRYGGGS